jgi:dihydrofolate reductase
MATVIYSMGVSLDGFIETLDHSLDWHIVDEELHSFVNRQQAANGAYLFGRRLYENMTAYWNTPQATDPANPAYVLEFARIWQAIPKVVFSNTLQEAGWGFRLVHGDAADEVARLKAQPGNTLAVGGAGLAASLVRRDLIDVYELFVQPVILGSGTPYLPPLDRRLDLHLTETHRFQSGVVQLRYERRKGS